MVMKKNKLKSEYLKESENTVQDTKAEKTKTSLSAYLQNSAEETMEEAKRSALDAYNRNVEANEETYKTAQQASDTMYDENIKQIRMVQDRALGEQQEALKQSQAENAFLREKVNKYLGEYLASKGVTGGMSETAKLDAQNHLISQRTEAAARAADNMADIRMAYGTQESEKAMEKAQADADRKMDFENKKLSLKQAYDSALDTAKAQYNKDMLDVVQSRIGETAEKASGAVANLQNLYYTYAPDGKLDNEGYNKMLRYLETVGIDPEADGYEDVKALLQLYEDDVNAAEDLDYTTRDVTVKTWNNPEKNGRNMEVTAPDGTDYKVQSGGEVTNAGVLSAAGKVGDGEVFMYGDKLYVKRTDGNQDSRVYLIEGRALSDASYKKLMKLFKKNEGTLWNK